MITIYFRGGMGNQMFQYALYRSLKAKGKNVFIYDNVHNREIKRRVSIKDYFNVDYEEHKSAINELVDNISQHAYTFIKKPFLFFEKIIRRRVNDNNVFDDNIFYLNNVILDGYWQSEKYFSDPEVQKQLRRDFTPLDTIEFSDEYKYLKKQINNTNSVSIHIRRDDYLKYPELYGGICTPEYYDRAIRYINEKEKKLTFYVFSDDKEYIKKMYSNKINFVLVNPNNNLTDFEEFLLMKECKHHIMAHSSYSWWAAWLNDDPESINIAPDRWLVDREYPDIYTDRMIKIKSN